MAHYLAILEESGSDKAVGIWFPDLPGCFSAGDNVEEALRNAAEAVTLYAEELAKQGRHLPDPRSITELRSDPAVAVDIRDHIIALVSSPVDSAHLQNEPYRPQNQAARSPSIVARLTAAESAACRLADFLAETLDPSDVVVATSDPSNPSWTVAVYFHSVPDQTAIRQLVSDVAGVEAGEAIRFETLAEHDWVAASLAGLQPVAAGRFVVHGRHDRARIGANRIGIEIEAALAFGTGHHGTTRGCLLALDRLLKARRPRRVLDVGTGSGVLAIAAARASRRPVLASDIDPHAAAAARENARANKAGLLVEVIRAAGLADRRFRARAPYDLGFANILLQPLRQLAKPLARLIAPQGRLVLSGLLVSQASAALAAYRPHGLTLERRIFIDGWATLVLVKRSGSCPAGNRTRASDPRTARQLQNLTG